MSAFNESATIVSVPAGTTFAATDIGKAIVINASGQAVVPNTTGNVVPFGALQSYTGSTSAGEAVSIATAGLAKVRLSASTLSAGDFISASTDGFWGAVTTVEMSTASATEISYAAGQIVSGSSGNIRLATAHLFGSVGTVTPGPSTL